MTPLHRVAIVGNYLPRRCGIATFTHDLHKAIAAARPSVETCVVAMTDQGQSYDYPEAVRLQIRDHVLGDYVQAADYLNRTAIDAVSLQHEYGIFGGDDGGNILELMSRLAMPIVTTLHTVLSLPSPSQRRVMDRVLDISSKVVVMSEKGRELLGSVHGIADKKIQVIAHGIPDVPFQETHKAKGQFGFDGKTVILTFGLLSPNKGIETMLDAMPAIIAACPDVMYVVLGATHPVLLRENGEAYRDGLLARIEKLKIGGHVVFFNQFVEQARLLDFISMCDVYVTPYLNEAQMTSGTLAYSFGSGKAVVSTPYWHARELLADGRGVLVPFADHKAMSDEICALLTNSPRHLAMRTCAYAASRSMVWSKTGDRYVAALQSSTLQRRSRRVVAIAPAGVRTNPIVVSPPSIQHLLSLCDSTGISQHAVHSVPDRAHGYCVDDNARALLLANGLAHPGEVPLCDAMTARFAAFVQHAWNSDIRRFRNFMSYDRRWLEPAGSEDSHGRTLWALGECARKDSSASRRRWAADLFQKALPSVEDFTSPRAWAFTLIGIDAYCAKEGAGGFVSLLRKTLADRLVAAITTTRSAAGDDAQDWHWFEDVLAYDNARLPQALIRTGLATGVAAYRDAGLQTLRWLTHIQTAPSGCFRPVGSQSFGRVRQAPLGFDQQPLEAWATISACIAAWHADGDARWSTEATRALEWFAGRNDLQQTLVDPQTGSCCDGLHPDRPNRNQGAESCLSYLHSLVEMREHQRTLSTSSPRTAIRLGAHIAEQPIKQSIKPGGHVVSITIPEPPDLAFAT